MGEDHGARVAPGVAPWRYALQGPRRESRGRYRALEVDPQNWFFRVLSDRYYLMRRVEQRCSNRGIVADQRPPSQHGEGPIESPARMGTQDQPNPSVEIDLPYHPAWRKRWRSKSKPARPYIWRFSSFTCWTDYTNRHTPYLGRYSRCACAFSDHSPEPGKLAPATSGGQTEGSTMSRATRKRHLPASASPSLS